MIHKLKRMCENLIDLSLNCKNILTLLRYINSLNLASLKVFKYSEKNIKKNKSKNVINKIF